MSWMEIYQIPSDIIKNIESIIANFLWPRFGPNKNILLAGLKLISRRQKKGSLGIWNIKRFNKVLLTTSLRHIFRDRGLCPSIMRTSTFRRVFSRCGYQHVPL